VSEGQQEAHRWAGGRLPTDLARHIARLLGELPDDYGRLRQALADWSLDFRAALAARLEPAFNQYLQSIPHQTLEQKKTLAKFVNYELSLLGLSVSCPKTGRAALLLAHPGRHAHEGRFVLQILTEDGRRSVKTASQELPYLNLMPYNMTREYGVDWYTYTAGRGR